MRFLLYVSVDRFFGNGLEFSFPFFFLQKQSFKKDNFFLKMCISIYIGHLANSSLREETTLV